MSVLFAQGVLVAVFALAGMAKLADRPGVRRMVLELGVPRPLAAATTWILAGCELGVAAALVVGSSARVAAALAVLLLTTFSAAIAVGLAHGRRPGCRCFGRLRAAPVGGTTLARNALLATIAGFVAANGRPPVVFAALAVLAGGAWLALSARAQTGRPAPSVSFAARDGRRWTLDALLAAGRPLLLVFGDAACAACGELLPRVARWQHEFDERLTVVVVEDAAAAAAFGVRATPSAALVDERGEFAAPLALGAERIEELVARATASPALVAVGRRELLARAAGGLAAAAVIEPAAAVAHTVSRALRPKRLKIDGAWLCKQRYALCTFAACKPSKTNGRVSVCRCKIKTGYSVGFKNCQQRAPTGRTLHSNFSLQDVTARTRALKCSARGLWVQCLDVVCALDPSHPGHALCQCVNQRTKDYYTFGANCDVKTCTSVIWSATTAPFPGGAQYEKGLKRLGIAYRVPKACPKHG